MHARTSQSYPLQIDTLRPVGRGRLGLTFCPGKVDPHAQTGAWDRDLDTDLCAVLAWGASTVVTLMETHELELLRVPDLGERVSRTGFAGGICRPWMAESPTTVSNTGGSGPARTCAVG